MALIAAALLAGPTLASAAPQDAPLATTPTAPQPSNDDLSAALRNAASAGAAEQQAEDEATTAIQKKKQNGVQTPDKDATTEALATALAVETAKATDAQQSAAAERAALQAKHVNEAFLSARQSLFPMTTDQIHSFMKWVEDTQKASIPPATGQPEPIVKVQNISLDPGSPPPVINVAVGYVTTLTILDMTGQPWPIIDIGVGGNFDIPQPEEGGHMIRISPLTRFGYGNLSVRLKDMPTPITFRLSAGNPTVYYRFDARIPKIGPLGKIPLIQRSMPLEAGDDTLMAILQNSPPPNAKRLKITGTDQRTEGWAVGTRTFLRTPLSLLSPSWNASVSSGDGTTVYEIGSAPVVLLSDNGVLLHAKVTEESAQ